VLIGYDNDVMGRSKRARTWRVSCLTFLPNSWWEYLDWVKEARTVVDQVTGRVVTRTFSDGRTDERTDNRTMAAGASVT
jgi:hypothetical protein